MLHALKIKPFDLQPVYATWVDPPKFNGKEKKDVTVVSWLAKVEEGCKQHRVPKDLWPEVAQHYLGEKAAKRLAKVKDVMVQMHGESYTWNWKRFKTAMENAHWELEGNKWARIGSMAISIFTKGEQPNDSNKQPTPPAKPSPDSRSFLQRTLTMSDKTSIGTVKDNERPKQPARSKSMFVVFSSVAENSKKEPPTSSNTLKKQTPLPPPSPPQKEETSLKRSKSSTLPKPSKGISDESRIEVPVWLLLACEALKDLNVEYPTTMGVVSAILITFGSIPSLPAVTAGAAGAFLAGGTAHAIGSIAVGLGGLLTAHHQATKSKVN